MIQMKEELLPVLFVPLRGANSVSDLCLTPCRVRAKCRGVGLRVH